MERTTRHTVSTLRGVPVAVGGGGARGVVAAASYEADGIWVEAIEPEPEKVVFLPEQEIEVTKDPFAGKRGMVCFAGGLRV